MDGINKAGAGPTFRVISMGVRLASVEDLPGSQQIVNKLRGGDESAESELHALHLLRSADPTCLVELEPTVGAADDNRKCDFRIKRDTDPWVYVEVTRPDTSEAQSRVEMMLQTICDRVTSINRAFALEVFFLREPTDEELATASAAAIEFCSVQQPADGVVRKQMPNGIGLLILNQQAMGQVVLNDHGEEKVPRLGMAKAITGQPNRRVAVRVPFADQRAKRLLTAEAKRLPTHAPGLIMVELAAAPGAFRSWEAIIRRRFQPAMHTRVGGVVLFSGGLAPTDRGIASVLNAKVIANPHAKISLPEWIGRVIGAARESYDRLIHFAGQTRPVMDENGRVVLYDMYVPTGGALQWIGSRRTLEQCQDSFDAYFRSARGGQVFFWNAVRQKFGLLFSLDRFD